MTFNPGQYQDLKVYLLQNNCNEWLADECAFIVAADDPHAPNLGRTESDRQIVWLAWSTANNVEPE